MGKTQVTYVMMILVFAAGLWAILRAGSGLRAAPDLGGEWTVAWDGAGNRPSERMTVNQSGRFLNVTLARADSSTLKLRGIVQQSGEAGTELVLKAVGEPLAMSATYDQSSQTFVGTAEGSGHWHATRIPKDSSR